MSLKNYKARERQVQLSDGSEIAVRGLSLANISEIAQVHGREVGPVFMKFMDRAESLTVADASSYSSTLLTLSPVIAAHVIAAGTGDSTALDEAAALPFGVQLQLLAEIGKLTLEVEGGAKKVLEIVIKIFQAGNQVLAAKAQEIQQA